MTWPARPCCVDDGRNKKVSLNLCQKSSSIVFYKSVFCKESWPRMGCFTLVQMKLCGKSWPPKFSSLVVQPKVGMVLPLALVRVMLMGRALRGGPVFCLKVTAEPPSTRHWLPLSRHRTNNSWCSGRWSCCCWRAAAAAVLFSSSGQGGWT